MYVSMLYLYVCISVGMHLSLFSFQSLRFICRFTKLLSCHCLCIIDIINAGHGEKPRKETGSQDTQAYGTLGRDPPIW